MTPRLAALFLLLGLLVALQGVVQAASSNIKLKQRVRREVRTLSDAEYRAYITALSTLTAVPTKAGRALFGHKYVSYNELLMKHAVAVTDPRGDQGHTGPCFMTFHRAFLLELEQSLLAVAPGLGALPYWDITLDAPGAKYFNTSKYIFGERYAGSVEGTAAVGNAVTNGVFAWRQVPRFIAAQWPQWFDIFNGSGSGYMRSADNINASPLLTRYPAKNLVEAIEASAANGTAFLPFGTLPVGYFVTDYLVPTNGSSSSTSNAQGYALKYPLENFLRCLNPKHYRSWMEWSFCADLTVLSAAPPEVTEELKMKYVGPVPKTTALLHAGVHWTVGSVGRNTSAKGDLYDVTTSPNELLLFSLHHANLDRSALTWQRNAARANTSMVAASWGYPATLQEYSTAAPGCLLNDVINALAPFKTLFPRKPANAAGFSHKELLWYTRPGVSPYIYDTMLLKQ